MSLSNGNYSLRFIESSPRRWCNGEVFAPNAVGRGFRAQIESNKRL